MVDMKVVYILTECAKLQPRFHNVSEKLARTDYLYVVSNSVHKRVETSNFALVYIVKPVLTWKRIPPLFAYLCTEHTVQTAADEVYGLGMLGVVAPD